MVTQRGPTRAGRRRGVGGVQQEWPFFGKFRRAVMKKVIKALPRVKICCFWNKMSADKA
jgi:hypothetical protein